MESGHALEGNWAQHQKTDRSMPLEKYLVNLNRLMVNLLRLISPQVVV